MLPILLILYPRHSKPAYRAYICSVIMMKCKCVANVLESDDLFPTL